MIEESILSQMYHLNDMFLSAELLISCSVLQLTFYVTSLSYTRKSGFVVLSQQIYHLGFLILFLSAVLLCNEDVLLQTFISVNDYLSFFSKLVVCVCSLVFISIIKTSYNDGLMKHNFEYVVLILIGVLGSLLLCSSNDLITAYLAMELQSVSFYLMAAFKKNSNYSIESGLKYFIVGSFASSLFLFGSSFIYGYTGSLNFDDFNLLFPLLFLRSVPVYSFMDISATILTFFEFLSLYIDICYGTEGADCFSILFLEHFFNIHDHEFSFFRNICIFCYRYNTCFQNYFSILVSVDLPLEFLVGETGILATETFSVKAPENTYFLTSLVPNRAFYGFDTEANLLCLTLIYSEIIPFETFNFNTDFFPISGLVNEFNNSMYDSFSDVSSTSMNLDLAYVGFMLVCLSLLIKLGVAPFHYWSLDVYEGSPNQSTFFFAVVPKIALFVLLARICHSGFYDFLIDWQFYFLILSLLSIFVGSVGGLEQRKLKSLLAYSSISHTGYLLLSFSTNIMEGFQMTMYYIVIFMLSGLCFWSIYMFLRQKLRTNYYNKQNKELGDLVLLRESNPMLSIALVITLFSIAGIPPLVGFLAKLGIFLSALSSSIYIVAFFSVLLSVISTFYYIRLIKIIFFENVTAGKLYYSISTNKSIIISVLFLLLILLCIYPISLYFAAHKIILLL